jgi:23S rRNA maturation mini-RNase III
MDCILELIVEDLELGCFSGQGTLNHQHHNATFELVGAHHQAHELFALIEYLKLLLGD